MNGLLQSFGKENKNFMKMTKNEEKIIFTPRKMIKKKHL